VNEIIDRNIKQLFPSLIVPSRLHVLNNTVIASSYLCITFVFQHPDAEIAAGYDSIL
jgi:hypothetical protein